MIATTLGALVAAEPALTRLAGERLALKTSYDLKKLLRLVRVETAHFESERVRFVKELGASQALTHEQRAAGTTEAWQVLPEHQETYGTRMAELAAVPVELQAHPLAIDALSAVPISATELAALEPLLTELGA